MIHPLWFNALHPMTFGWRVAMVRSAGTKSMKSALQEAVEAGDLQAVIAALDNGGDIEEADMHGHRGLPLRMACFRGHADIVRELLRRGADVHAPNAQGTGAPVRMAVRCEHYVIVRLLVEHGAEIPFDLALPLDGVDERRQRRDRRQHDDGPPSGLKERRCTQDRRVTFVGEVALSDLQWSAYFAQARAKAVHVDEAADTASLILARARD